jgi:hypothetical protein
VASITASRNSRDYDIDGTRGWIWSAVSMVSNAAGSGARSELLAPWILWGKFVYGDTGTGFYSVFIIFHSPNGYLKFMQLIPYATSRKRRLFIYRRHGSIPIPQP